MIKKCLDTKLNRVLLVAFAWILASFVYVLVPSLKDSHFISITPFDTFAILNLMGLAFAVLLYALADLYIEKTRTAKVTCVAYIAIIVVFHQIMVGIPLYILFVIRGGAP